MMKRLILSVTLVSLTWVLGGCPGPDHGVNRVYSYRECGVLETDRIYMCIGINGCNYQNTPVVVNYNQLVNGLPRLTVLQINSSQIQAQVNDLLNDTQEHEVCAHSNLLQDYADSQMMTPQLITVQDSFVNTKLTSDEKDKLKQDAVSELNRKARSDQQK